MASDQVKYVTPMTWDSRRPKSAWREFSFAWNEVRRAIDPGVGLTKTIADWENISKELREAPRKRRPQLARHLPDARLVSAYAPR